MVEGEEAERLKDLRYKTSLRSSANKPQIGDHNLFICQAGLAGGLPFTKFDLTTYVFSATLTTEARTQGAPCFAQYASNCRANFSAAS